MRNNRDILGIIVCIFFLGSLFLINCLQPDSQAQIRLSLNSANATTNKLEKVEKKFSTTNISPTKQENDLETFFSTDTCKKLSKKDEKLLCNQIIRDNEGLQEPLIKRFEYKSFYVDLNNDGTKEIIIWNNSICGSSGCEIYLYAKTQRGFRKLWGEDIGWTPIIILNSRKTGWKDIAFQIAGGGVEAHFQILQFSKGIYKSERQQKEQPKGKIILDKNWNQTFYGPIPK